MVIKKLLFECEIIYLKSNHAKFYYPIKYKQALKLRQKIKPRFYINYKNSLCHPTIKYQKPVNLQ